METGNKWFKFYGQDWLTDLKIMRLSVEDRLCYITLLCLASASSEQGVIRDCDEEAILQLTHLYNNPYEDDNEYSRAKGCLQRFVERGMIARTANGDVHIKAFEKRQSTNLTNAERQAKFRSKHTESYDSNADDVTKVTLEKNRIEKNRKEEKREDGPESSVSFLKNLPTEFIEEMKSTFNCSEKQVRDKAADLVDWCEATGKRKKNYRAFLRVALRKDFGELSEEDKKKNAELRERVLALKRKMTL